MSDKAEGLDLAAEREDVPVWDGDKTEGRYIEWLKEYEAWSFSQAEPLLAECERLAKENATLKARVPVVCEWCDGEGQAEPVVGGDKVTCHLCHVPGHGSTGAVWEEGEPQAEGHPPAHEATADKGGEK